MDKTRMKEIVDELTNTYESRSELMLNVLRELHPTLQQTFTGLCLAWINELPQCRIDDRNRSSAGVCRKLVELYTDDTGEEKIRDKFMMI